MKRLLHFWMVLFVTITSLALFNSCQPTEDKPKKETANYKITFDTNGGSSIGSVTIESGKKVDRPSDPTRDGYEFGDWYKDESLTAEFDFSTPITSNLTIYASWRELAPMVKFESNGGSEITSIEIDSEGKVKKPTKPTKEGSYFGGWYTDKECTTLFDFYSKVTEETTLYAKWRESNQYVVMFEIDDSYQIEINSQTIDYNNQAIEPTAPTKEGFVFEGWFVDSECTILYDFTKKISEDTALYARWSIATMVTVTFESNGGSTIAPQTITAESTATKPTNPTKSNYNFAGWYSDSSCAQQYNFADKVVEDITLYAKWSNIEQCTVTFDSNGGSVISEQLIDKNNTATKPTDPTRTGYTFAGWYSDIALNQSYDFSSKISESITLYAKWNVNKYSVTFNSNGGSVIKSQNIEFGSTATKPTDPTKSNYNFAGWYSDSSCTQQYNFANKVSDNITLYAKWSETTTIIVTFDTAGGTTISNQYIKAESGKATKPTNPTKLGYTFAGWYKDAACTISWDFNNTISSNITIYAKWKGTSGGELPNLGVDDAW